MCWSTHLTASLPARSGPWCPPLVSSPDVLLWQSWRCLQFAHLILYGVCTEAGGSLGQTVWHGHPRVQGSAETGWSPVCRRRSDHRTTALLRSVGRDDLPQPTERSRPGGSHQELGCIAPGTGSVQTLRRWSAACAVADD